MEKTSEWYLLQIEYLQSPDEKKVGTRTWVIRVQVEKLVSTMISINHPLKTASRSKAKRSNRDKEFGSETKRCSDKKIGSQTKRL